MSYIFWVSFFMSLIMAVDLALTPRSFWDQAKGFAFVFFFVSTMVSAIQLVF